MQKVETVDNLSENKEKPKTISDVLGLKPFIAIPNSVSAIIIDRIDI